MKENRRSIIILFITLAVVMPGCGIVIPEQCLCKKCVKNRNKIA